MSFKIRNTRNIVSVSSFFLLILLTFPLQAQQPYGSSKTQTYSGLQKEDQEDRLFIFHSVRKRETVFSIAQKNNVTSEDIFNNNPQSRDGIKAGDVLKIPKPKISASEATEVVIHNSQPVKHVVGRKETLYSIAKQYNTTQEEILKINPAVKGILTKGTVLIIPGSSVSPDVQKQGVESSAFSNYRIVSGDNYFQLKKRFGVSQAELEQLNPELKDGFKSGITIKIPNKEFNEIKNQLKTDSNPPTNAVHVAEPSETAASSVLPFNSDKTFEIGVFLPFCQDLSDSARIAQRAYGFFEFYSGVLLATQKMTEAGMKIKLFVYDTYQDSKVVEKLVKKPEFLSLDLIIGPVYPDNQKLVAELSAKNHIPMVSPLSSDNRFVAITPGYYQINPERKLRVAGTADYIAENYADQNIIMLNHGSDSGDEKLIFDRISHKQGKIRHYNIWAEGTSTLETMLKTDVENIVVLTDASEVNVSVALTRLNTISKTNKITVIGLQEYTKMQSIDIEHLHNLRFHYLSPYFIDYTNSNVNAFIEKYRFSFDSEPTPFSFQGYDIALYFLSSLGKSGKNFTISSTSNGVDLLQAEYRFQKLSGFGGYMNSTLYVIEYSDNYEVKSVGKIIGTILPPKGGANN
jgi:LysM repeat protein